MSELLEPLIPKDLNNIVYNYVEDLKIHEIKKKVLEELIEKRYYHIVLNSSYSHNLKNDPKSLVMYSTDPCISKYNQLYYNVDEHHHSNATHSSYTISHLLFCDYIYNNGRSKYYYYFNNNLIT